MPAWLPDPRAAAQDLRTLARTLTSVDFMIPDTDYTTTMKQSAIDQVAQLTRQLDEIVAPFDTDAQVAAQAADARQWLQAACGHEDAMEANLNAGRAHASVQTVIGLLERRPPS